MTTADKYAVDMSFYPDGTMLFEFRRIGKWGTDPFTDRDKHNFIEIAKWPGLEYNTDGEGSYWNLSSISPLTTEGTGTVEGEIYILTMLHHMDEDTFKAIEKWTSI